MEIAIRVCWEIQVSCHLKLLLPCWSPNSFLCVFMLHSLRLNVICIFFSGVPWSCWIVEVFISFIHLASIYNVYVVELMLTNSALILNYDVNMVWKNYLSFEEQGILLYAINMGLNASYFSLMLNTFMIHSLSLKCVLWVWTYFVCELHMHLVEL